MSRARPRSMRRASAITSARLGDLRGVFIVRQSGERLTERSFPAMVIGQSLDHAGDISNDFVGRQRGLVEAGRAARNQFVGQGAWHPKAAVVANAKSP